MDVLGRKIFGKTLFYPGCLLKFKANHLLESYERVLSHVGVSYVKLDGIEQCCGLPAYNAGYLEDFRNIVDANSQVFSDQNISKVITVCSGCCSVLSNDYHGLKVEHVTQVIARNLDKIVPKSFSEEPEEITYHGSCDSSRSQDIDRSSRAILVRLGFKVKELKNNRGDCLCCGSGGGLKENSPRIANKIAKQLLAKTDTKRLVTACPNCYLHLKANAESVDVIELSELMLE